MNDTKNEVARLDNISKNSLYNFGANLKTIEYSFDILKRYLKAGTDSILEMGPAEGVMTDFLVPLAKDITIVEGSELFASDLKRRYPKADIHCSLFEDFHPEKKYDVIVMGHVLEHVEDPVAILEKAKDWLDDDGFIFAAVPNAHSIHRQAAVLMGLQEKENSMSELDWYHGHRRVYNIEEFNEDFMNAGLKIRKCGGYWLKPVSDRQIEESWTPEMLKAFMVLGESYPEIAAEIYIIAGL